MISRSDMTLTNRADVDLEFALRNLKSWKLNIRVDVERENWAGVNICVENIKYWQRQVDTCKGRIV